MLKLSHYYALTLVLLSHRPHQTKATCNNGIISEFTGICNYANFIANLQQSSCTLAELFPSPTAINQTAIEMEIAALCKYDAPVQFVEILGGTYQDDRRYFAGGGDIVESPLTPWDVVTGRLERFETNLASNTLIAFPQYAARVKYNQQNGLGNNGYPANMNLEKSCGLRTVMCCFTKDGGMGNFIDEVEGDLTTDVCRHDLADSPQSNHIASGFSVFPGDDMTTTHCTGFTWNAANADLVGNMMYDISLRNTLTKGYMKGVPGAPMCGCVEHMPIVESATCRTATKVGDIQYTFTYEDGELSASNTIDITYEDCGMDLAYKYKSNNPNNATLIDAHLVGDGGCTADLEEYLNEDQFLVEGVNPNRYITPDNTRWEQVIGMGTHFLPPIVDPTVSDTEFRGQLEACLASGLGRHCIFRRVCDSCTSLPHRDMYYKRLTPLPPPGTNTTAGEVYFLNMFMNRWASYKNGLNTDFELYSTYQDALDGTNRWLFCNYDYFSHPVGFPRDCGPYSYTSDQWNSYTQWMPDAAKHHGYFVEKPE